MHYLFLLLALVVVVGVLHVHSDREPDVVGVLLDQSLDLILVEELVVALVVGVVLHFQDYGGAHSLLLGVLHGVAVNAVGLPLEGLVRAVGLCDDCYLLGYHEGRIESHAKLSDDVHVLAQLVVLLEVEGAGICDSAQVVLQLLLGHADAVVGDSEGAGVLVHSQLDSEIVLVKSHRGVGQRLEIELVDSVAGVGDELPEEYLLVSVDRVDHHIQEPFGLRLEFLGLHSYPSFALHILALSYQEC